MRSVMLRRRGNSLLHRLSAHPLASSWPNSSGSRINSNSKLRIAEPALVGGSKAPNSSLRFPLRWH